MNELEEIEPEPLTTKNAVKFILDGTLRLRVCRYCLKICSNLSELDEILEVGINGGLHEVTIKDIVASFHPFKVDINTSFPNKICKVCLQSAMNAYLFTQQCERAERALRNCFEDINEKYDKLDPIVPVKKRGKRKLNPNPNILYVEKKNVIDYAEPIINIINTNSIIVDNVETNSLECQKCWLVLPSPQSLVNHEESHPKSMWYHCKLCGKSFVKRFHLRQHMKKLHKSDKIEPVESPDGYICNECGDFSKTLGQHFQHIEKHKFKCILQYMIERQMNRLCVLCLEDGLRMTSLSEIVSLHGGYPGLNGEYSIQDIVSSVFPYKHQGYPISKNSTTISLQMTLKTIWNRRLKLPSYIYQYECLAPKTALYQAKHNYSKKIKTNHVKTEKNDYYKEKKLCKICWIFNKPCTCMNIFERNVKFKNCTYCWLFSRVNKCAYCLK